MKKILTLLLAAAVLVSSSACGAPEEKSAPQGVIKLAGFECLDELWYGVRRDFIGVAELNDNEKYVSEGEKSLKLTIDGPSDNAWFLRTYGVPYLPNFQLFRISEYIPDFDVKAATEFTLDVYNPSDRTMYITFVMDRAKEAYDWYETIYSVVAEIPPDGLTTAHFPVNRAFMTEKWDIVGSFAFTVYDPGAFSYGTELYFDNFCVNLSKEKDAGLRKSFDKNEILNFAAQSDCDYIAPYFSTNLLNGCYAVSSAAPGGGSALRYELVGFDGSNGMMNIDYMSSNEKVGLRVSPDVLGIFDFGEFDTISFEVYSRDRNLRRFYIELEDKSGKKYVSYRDVQPDEWTEVSIAGFRKTGDPGIRELRIYTNAYNIFEPSDFFIRNLGYGRAK